MDPIIAALLAIIEEQYPAFALHVLPLYPIYCTTWICRCGGKETLYCLPGFDEAIYRACNRCVNLPISEVPIRNERLLAHWTPERIDELLAKWQSHPGPYVSRHLAAVDLLDKLEKKRQAVRRLPLPIAEEIQLHLL